MLNNKILIIGYEYFLVDETAVELKADIKYLGVILDIELQFTMKTFNFKNGYDKYCYCVKTTMNKNNITPCGDPKNMLRSLQ